MNQRVRTRRLATCFPTFSRVARAAAAHVVIACRPDCQGRFRDEGDASRRREREKMRETERERMRGNDTIRRSSRPRGLADPWT